MALLLDGEPGVWGPERIARETANGWRVSQTGNSITTFFIFAYAEVVVCYERAGAITTGVEANAPKDQPFQGVTRCVPRGGPWLWKCAVAQLSQGRNPSWF